jgi:hypothetical protein
MKAVLLLKDKSTDMQGNLIERVVWEIPLNRMYKEGVRYRLAFIPCGMKKTAVLYDNHHPKGHHKHLEDFELPYLFSSIEKLLIDFQKDIDDWKKFRG